MQIVSNETNLKETDATLELSLCPLCKSNALHNDFIHQGYPVQSCKVCRLKLLNPQPSDQTLSSIYEATNFLTGYVPEADPKISELKRATAQLYLEMLEEYGITIKGRKLLAIGRDLADLLVESQARGFDVTGLEYKKPAAEIAKTRLAGTSGRVFCGQLEYTDLPETNFDICILADVLENNRNPENFLKVVHRLLKPGGIILLTLPSLDSWSARLLGKHWTQFKPEHLYYFKKSTLETLLFLTNFNRVLIQPAHKVVSPGYVVADLNSHPRSVLTPLARLTSRLLPGSLRDRPVKLATGGLVAIARKQEIAPRQKVSVIMPVFNERKTFSQVMEQLIHKELDGLDMEIVVVESNSTDGTREEVLKYQKHPRVRLILEEKPRGKGHAVRTGLAHATGDYILIQDADLEYDMDDYDELLVPLRAGMTAFVLGSRHGFNGAWKMRHFTDQPEMSLFLNFGHILFTTLLNTLYGQRTKDPFTMYKVFRRDCLFGLKFECNRFDFDHELVIKLWRKGYKALELPVSYSSRSFSEGKKVSIFRDPLTWIRAIAKFRVTSLNVIKNVREANLAELAALSRDNLLEFQMLSNITELEGEV
jgi:glycosyltransferase involved in cell wall biosynthesis/2-polyprenyl-3-methyl-5-hydroxy-6-metoxy-1,4-benzoquinol methylase